MENNDNNVTPENGADDLQTGINEGGVEAPAAPETPAGEGAPAMPASDNVPTIEDPADANVCDSCQ